MSSLDIISSDPNFDCQIRRYVEVHSSKSIFRSRNAQMVDVSLNGMTISCNSQNITIPFDPPLKTFREARERLVQMDNDALQTLDRSDIPVTGYVPPYTNLGHLCNFTVCSLAWILVSRPENARPGSLIYDNLLYLFPAYAKFTAEVSTYVFIGMLVIHVFEAGIMAGKLNRHGMTPFELTWWKWIGSAFAEGITCFWRLNEMLEKNRMAKAAKKH